RYSPWVSRAHLRGGLAFGRGSGRHRRGRLPAADAYDPERVEHDGDDGQFVHEHPTGEAHLAGEHPGEEEHDGHERDRGVLTHDRCGRAGNHAGTYELVEAVGHEDDVGTRLGNVRARAAHRDPDV